jgi:glycosyltransferase involved in cell wall biosynthesis
MGGAERLTIPYIKNLNNENFRLRVCMLQERDGNHFAGVLREMGIPVDKVTVRHLRDLSAIPRLVHYLYRQKADLVHTQLEFSNTLGNIAAKILRLPSVCTLHTIENPEKGSKTHRRLRVMYWSLRNFCNRVITVSEELRKHHIAVSKSLPERVVTLYNGIDQSHFEDLDIGKKNMLRGDLGIPPDAPLILTVAVLREPKGIQYMLEAMPAVLTAAPEAYFLIVGDGEYRQSLEEITRDLQISHRVIFAGYREDIPDMLAIGDVFVLPSLTEALPTVIAEAMVTGLPIIASTVGGIPEMVEDQRNGILVPPGDPESLSRSCLRLLQNREVAQQMGREGRSIAARKFDIQKQARQLGEMYFQLLRNYGKLAPVQNP